jgi:hypothetical protein
MAMNKAALAAAMAIKIEGVYGVKAPAGQQGNRYWFIEQLAKAIADAVVEHIQANAKCNGTDLPQGNTHDNVGIV